MKSGWIVLGLLVFEFGVWSVADMERSKKVENRVDWVDRVVAGSPDQLVEKVNHFLEAKRAELKIAVAVQFGTVLETSTVAGAGRVVFFAYVIGKDCQRFGP